MKICQSCGIPLNKDSQGGGTNADGSKNTKYCSFCYQNGEFVGGEIAVEIFQDFCRKTMIKHGTPRLLAWLFTRGMKRLDRWNKRH